MATLDIDIEELSKKTELFSGADLISLCTEVITVWAFFILIGNF